MAKYDVIENGNSFKPVAETTTDDAGTSTTLIPSLVTIEEKAKKKNDVKARSIESLDLIFNRLQKLVSQLAVFGVFFSQEDLNLKFLRSLPFEWNTHVVVWRNKLDLDTMSLDDLYNNFKIVEQEVRGTTIPTVFGVSTASPQVSTANLSDATVYAFLTNQPNGSQLVHEDLEQIHEDDLEEMDLKRTVNMEDISSKAMVVIDGAGFDWSYMADDEAPINMAFMALLDSEGDALETKIEKFENTSQSLDKLIGSQVTNNSKKGLGYVSYNAPPPPHTKRFSPPRIDLSHTWLPEFVKPSVQSYGVKPIEVVTQKSSVKTSAPIKENNGNISYLTDFKEFDEGYVAFGGGAKGDHLGNFDGKSYEGFFIGYSTNSKAFRVYNTRTRKLEENLHTKFLENKSLIAGTNSNDFARKGASFDAGQSSMETKPSHNYILMPLWNEGSLFDSSLKDSDGENRDNDGPINTVRQSDDFFSADNDMTSLDGVEVDIGNISTTYPVPTTPNTRIYKDHSLDNTDVKSAFLYGRIEKEVYVCQPPRFEDFDYPDKVYKVEKALYGLHQDPKAWYETLAKYLLDNRFCRGKIDQTLFIKRQKEVILLVQVYFDDIIFRSTKKELCTEFEYEDVKPVSTPMDKEKALLKDSDGGDVNLHIYMSMIGSLMYLTSSRPDIMFV
nr:hypothetical protein [Tanacetum cinerariifolium]